MAVKIGTEIQVEDGNWFKIHNQIAEALAQADLSGVEFRLLWHLLRMTYGWKRKEAKISYEEFARATNTSRQNAHKYLKRLTENNIITAVDNGPRSPKTWSFNKYSDQWFDSPVLLQHDSPVLLQHDSPVLLQHDSPVLLQHDTYKDNIKTIKDKKERECVLARDRQPEPAKPQAPPPAFAEPTGDIYMDAAVNKWNRRQAGQAVHPGQFQQGEWNKQVPASERVPLLEAIADLTGKRPMWEADDVRIGNLLHEAAIKAHQWGYTPGHLRRLEEAWIADWRSGGKRAGRIDQFVEFLSEQKANGGKPATPPPSKSSAPQSIVSDDLMAWMEKQAHEQFLASRTN